MRLSMRRARFVIAGLLMASASAAQTPLVDPACEAYNGATSVFVGVAGAPVWEWVNWPDRPDQPAVRMKLTPFAVERTYVGERRPTMFVTPLGLEAWATAG